MRGIQVMAAMMLAGTSLAGEPAPVPVVERLLAESGKIKTIQCEIRREAEAQGQAVPTLSRVWFGRPDRLRVEMSVPEARRIVVDGIGIHKWIEGQTLGVRIPLTEAPPGELIQVRRVPGTADEQLMRIREYAEKALPPTEAFPVRCAYEPPAPHPYTVLSLDASGRLARLEFFATAAATNRLLLVEYEGWKEAKPGIWIPCLQKMEARGRDGSSVRETLRVSGLVVNEPIPPEAFDPLKQAPGIRFLSPEEAQKALKK